MAFLPEALIAPLRLTSSNTLMEQIFAEPLLFASHYAAVTTAMHWPEHVEATRRGVQSRYEKHDEVLVLMEKLGGQVPVALSADLAIRLAEGLEIRHAILADEYRDLCQEQLAAFVDLQKDGQAFGNKLPGNRLMHLAELLDFSPAETKLLIYALAHTVVPELQLLTRLFIDRPMYRQAFWKSVLDLAADDLARALSPLGQLAGSGLLKVSDGIPEVSAFWAKVILSTDDGFESCIVEPLAYKESPGGASRLPTEDREIVVQLLQQPGTRINILIYGKSAVDKINLAHRLIHEAGQGPYGLLGDIPEPDRPAAVMVAQRMLARRSDQPVLVVPTVQAILTRAIPDGFRFFGLGDEEEGARPLDERILSENPVPTVWITHDPSHLYAETLSRFLFHTEAQKGTRADRQALVDSLIAELPVTERHKSELIKLEGLSAQQLLSARMLAEMTAGKSRKAFARNLLVAAMRSQKALARRGKDEVRIPETTYSLDYINAAGRFGPEKVLKAFQHRPKGSLCLYGLPGTGKTQFAEHLALELGKRILIKRASEIFDKYLGESEKRIAEIFDQAEEEDAVLLLDEADSFLRDRSRSTHAWEVSTVNELLQHMERFEGVFVCTTNLFAQIDVAALRRFTFKLEFLPLNAEQRWEMFLNEAGLRDKEIPEELQSAYEEQLALMKNLAPGDFATVKRQCNLLGEELSPDQWIGQLEVEVRAKNRPEHEESNLQRAA